jgi:hypothetical protein
MLFVGGRNVREDKVFVLRAFENEAKAKELYRDLCGLYAKDKAVDLLFGTYQNHDAFFRAEPTWDEQFKGNREPASFGI